jgi:DNA-3-methyladenine glycosylase I
MEKKRCDWAGTDPLMQKYHDEEWGVICRDETKLFEMLILEGAQAGLSWQTVLNKRENYRKAMSGFDPSKIAKYTQKKIDSLLQNPGIIRNKLKVNSAVKNAKAFLVVQKEFGSFYNYLWSFVDGKQVINRWKSMQQMPATSELSDRLSKDLKKRGFNFVGSTICYSYLQAVGIIDDHLVSCSFKPK